MRNASGIVFRIVLAIAGLFAVLTGLDQALGGLRTLGWMGQPEFFAVRDEAAFLVADNHQRFLGGVWTGMGLAILVAATNVARFEGVLRLCFFVVFVGGLARFSQLNLEVTLGSAVVGSLVAELVGMPALYLWLSRVLARARKLKACSASP